MNQQQLILNALTERMTQAGWTFTIDYDFSNNGIIRIVDPTTLATTTGVEFKFERDLCTFTRPGSDDWVAVHWYGKERTSQSMKVKSTPGEVIDAVMTYLTGNKQ